jgi:hypothetical protein
MAIQSVRETNLSFIKPTRRTLRHLACVAVLFALIIAVGYVYYGSGKSELIREEHEKLYALADLKTRQLHDWIDERKGDAAFFLNSIPVARTLSGFLESRSVEDKKSTLQCLEALKKRIATWPSFLSTTKAGPCSPQTGKKL